MPIKLNVGLSRKVGEANYGSRGASINLEMEVDTSVAADPSQLQTYIHNVFDLVRTALEQELRGRVVTTANVTPAALARVLRSRNTSRQPNGRAQRPATTAQSAALRRLADQGQMDLPGFLQERYGVDRPEALTVAQASQAIDALKESLSKERSDT